MRMQVREENENESFFKIVISIVFRDDEHFTESRSAVIIQLIIVSS